MLGSSAGPARWLVPALAGALVLANLAVYAQTFQFSFVNFDDDRGLFKNPWVQGGLTWHGVRWAFTTFHLGNWIPVAWLSHLFDFTLFGPDPGWHHLMNVAVHIVNALLLFFLLIRWTRVIGPSAAVAFLWSLHPLRVESVAWIIERKDVLSAFFALLAVWLYGRYAETGSRLRYGGVVLAMLLGLLAKPMLVTLPFVLLLLDVWPLGRLGLAQRPTDSGSSRDRIGARAVVSWNAIGSRSTDPSSEATSPRGSGIGIRLLEKVHLFALSALASLVAILAQQRGGAVRTLEQIPLATRAANAVVACAAYLAQTVWPSGLAVYYPYDIHLPAWKVLGAVLLVGGVTLLGVLAASKHPGFLVGWLWYLGTLVPVVGLVQVGAQARADRYTYLPSIGLVLGAVHLVLGVAGPGRTVRRGLALLCVGLTVILGAASWNQTRFWKDSVTLFERALAVTEGSAIAHYNLASAFAQQERIDEAIAHYRETLRLNPLFPDANANLGLALFRQGRAEESIAHYRAELRLNPQQAEARCHLGVALAVQGKMGEALDEFDEAVRIKPGYADAHYNRAMALERRGRVDEAAVAYARALELEPGNVDALHSLAMVEAGRGRLERAEALLDQLVLMRPGDPRAAEDLRSLRRRLGRPATSIR